MRNSAYHLLVTAKTGPGKSTISKVISVCCRVRMKTHRLTSGQCVLENYMYDSGISIATPIAAGACALS
jgi:hypothetical protein